MSNNKKDLTRIEDLGEFIHELNEDEDASSFEDLSSEVPDLPTENFESSFDLEESSESFGSEFNSDEESSLFSGTDDESEIEETPTWDQPAEEVPETSWESTSELDNESSFTETSWEDSTPETTSFDEPDSLGNLTEEFSKSETISRPANSSVSEPDDWEVPIETPIPAPSYEAPRAEYKAPETFEDLKKFSESSSFTGMATEGNPSFSVLLKNVRYVEDVNDIISLLRELNLLSDTEEQTKSRLMRGMLLVPRISEYAAIFLAHKLRRFDIDIQLGLSDEIHPPKHQETPETGIVSKFSLYQNQSHHFHFDDPKLEISQIIVSATPNLEGHQIIRYIGVASEHKMLDNHIVEDAESTEIPLHYQELAQKLKAHALKANSNAVIGLNYQLTPIGNKYRLTCTGNLVWINKI